METRWGSRGRRRKETLPVTGKKSRRQLPAYRELPVRPLGLSVVKLRNLGCVVRVIVKDVHQRD